MSETLLVGEGTVVTMHYTLKNSEGELIDQSSEEKPLAYLHGAKNIVPGLERELTGKSSGDKLSVVVPAADGYGEPMGPGPQEIPRDAFPEDAELHAGMQFIAQGPDGQAFPLWIVKISDETILVDANHPLAGVALHFDVEITGVRAASDEEIAHGHPHGPGGHSH